MFPMFFAFVIGMPILQIITLGNEQKLDQALELFKRYLNYSEGPLVRLVDQAMKH